MKKIYVIVITCLVFWIDNEVAAKEDQPERSILKEGSCNECDGVPTVCPFPEPGNKTVHLPHETDCTKFYKCFLGKGVEFNCPLSTPGDPVSRLHYNRREQVCDWTWRAGCINCPLRDRNGNWPRSRISHESNNCNMYYECINGEKKLQYCPLNTCFSRTCQRCVRNRAGGNYAYNECPRGERLRHEFCDCNYCDSWCTKYYECENGDYFVKTCPDGSYFDCKLNRCNRKTCPDGFHFDCKLKMCVPSTKNNSD